MPFYQIDLGGGYCNFGNLVSRWRTGRRKPGLVWQGHRHARSRPSRLSRETLPQEEFANSHLGRARAYDALAKKAEAAKEWDRAIDLSMPAEQLEVRAMPCDIRGLGLERSLRRWPRSPN